MVAAIAIRVICGLILWLFSLVGAAGAEKRIALVIGNSNYEHEAKLPNPINDATTVADLLKNAGFDIVDARFNLANADFKRAIRQFTYQARDADMAVVYFAGHGIEVGGTNYLIPVDAKLATDVDTEDEAVSLDRVIKAIEPAKRLRLVILDACRDNPFSDRMKRTFPIRAVTKGLARVEPPFGDTLIAFAARAGSIADDGTGKNSPFTAALVKYLALPGLYVRIALGHVRDEVLQSTANRQEPFVYGSLGGATVALVPLPPKPASGEAAVASDARRGYELAAQVGNKEAWDAFLTAHADGFYADLARAQRAKLDAPDQSRMPVPTAPTGPRIEPARPAAALDPVDIARLLQSNPRRVGCDPGVMDGNWNESSRRALAQFNRNAGTKLDWTIATLHALDAVKAKTSRVCPVVCEKDYRVEGERCVEVPCRAGSLRDANGACIRNETPNKR